MQYRFWVGLAGIVNPVSTLLSNSNKAISQSICCYLRQSWRRCLATSRRSRSIIPLTEPLAVQISNSEPHNLHTVNSGALKFCCYCGLRMASGLKLSKGYNGLVETLPSTNNVTILQGLPTPHQRRLLLCFRRPTMTAPQTPALSGIFRNVRLRD